MANKKTTGAAADIPAVIDPEILSGEVAGVPASDNQSNDSDCGCGCSGEGFKCKAKKLLKKLHIPFMIAGTIALAYLGYKYFTTGKV